MKGIFFAVLMVCCSYATAFTEHLTDPAFKACVQALSEKKGWQSVKDVTAIKCHKKSIRSIQGVEQFTNLKVLSLFNNKIKQLGLLNLSKLEELNVARNGLSSLSLDGGLPELRKLYVFSNRLKRMSLKRLPSLQLLKANDNGMRSFTYSNLPKLEKVYIFNNELEHVDIDHLPNMSYMDCRQNPMPDALYEEMDLVESATILHDGNADDW